jgi:hypothetical protein
VSSEQEGVVIFLETPNHDKYGGAGLCARHWRPMNIKRKTKNQKRKTNYWQLATNSAGAELSIRGT